MLCCCTPSYPITVVSLFSATSRHVLHCYTCIVYTEPTSSKMASMSSFFVEISCYCCSCFSYLFVVTDHTMLKAVNLVCRFQRGVVIRHVCAFSTADGPMKNFVSIDFVKSNLKTLKILDASWHMPGSNRYAYSEYMDEHLPGRKCLCLSVSRSLLLLFLFFCFVDCVFRSMISSCRSSIDLNSYLFFVALFICHRVSVFRYR